MNGQTTAAIQGYLDELDGVGGATGAGPVVSALLDRAVGRLHRLCAGLLYRRYPRLARPPLGLEPEDLLGAVVERLLRALREARPRTVREFFGLANQHIRWELNDLARRLDERPPAADVAGAAVPAHDSSGGELGPDARRILAAIEALPADEQEVLSLVRIQGLTHAEVADLLGVATKTVQRRLNRALVLLTQSLSDLQRPPRESAGPP